MDMDNYYYKQSREGYSNVPAAAGTPGAAILGVDHVSKKTVCDWFLILFWVVGFFYLIQVLTMIVTMRRPSMGSLKWFAIYLLIVAVIMANYYFMYAMCAKLPPEAFTVGPDGSAAAMAGKFDPYTAGMPVGSLPGGEMSSSTMTPAEKQRQLQRNLFLLAAAVP